MRKIAILLVAAVLLSTALVSTASADGFLQDLYDNIKDWGSTSSKG